MRTVRGPSGLPVVEAAAGQLGQVAAVGADGPDVEPTVAVGLEDDVSVGPDVRTSRLVGCGGESAGLPTARRDPMEEPVRSITTEPSGARAAAMLVPSVRVTVTARGWVALSSAAPAGGPATAAAATSRVVPVAERRRAWRRRVADVVVMVLPRVSSN